MRVYIEISEINHNNRYEWDKIRYMYELNDYRKVYII